MTEDNSDEEGIRCVQSASLYTISLPFAGSIDIETTVARSVSGVESWISKAATGTVFGLETGWNPGCRSNSLETLHLFTPNQCLIIQLDLLPHIPDSLKSFCADEHRHFVGVEIHESVYCLREEYGIEFGEKITALGYEEMKESLLRQQNWMGQKEVVSALMGFYLIKNMSTQISSGWGNDVLDIYLVKQATVEAYVSYTIGRNLVVSSGPPKFIIN